MVIIIKNNKNNKKFWLFYNYKSSKINTEEVKI